MCIRDRYKSFVRVLRSLGQRKNRGRIINRGRVRARGQSVVEEAPRTLVSYACKVLCVLKPYFIRSILLYSVRQFGLQVVLFKSTFRRTLGYTVIFTAFLLTFVYVNIVAVVVLSAHVW